MGVTLIFDFGDAFDIYFNGCPRFWSFNENIKRYVQAPLSASYLVLFLLQYF